MEAIPTKTKKRKPKTKSHEETIALIGGPAEVACSDDDILLSPLSPHYGDSGVSPEEKEPLISAESALHDVENPVQDVVCSAPEAPPEDELSAGVSHLAIAPELDLLSTNFDQYIREEGEPVDPSLSLQSDFDGSRNAQKSLLGCSNIEDEYTEVLEAVSKTPELQPFAEGQLLPLYHNTEIEQAQILVENFLEDELRSGSVQRHPLYELLQRYLKSRDKLNANVVEIETLIKETKEIQQRLWILETVKVTEAGECQVSSYAVSRLHLNKIFNFLAASSILPIKIPLYPNRIRQCCEERLLCSHILSTKVGPAVFDNVAFRFGIATNSLASSSDDYPTGEHIREFDFDFDYEFVYLFHCEFDFDFDYEFKYLFHCEFDFDFDYEFEFLFYCEFDFKFDYEFEYLFHSEFDFDFDYEFEYPFHSEFYFEFDYEFEYLFHSEFDFDFDYEFEYLFHSEFDFEFDYEFEYQFHSDFFALLKGRGTEMCHAGS
ncbi:unnamed protein product [Nesidiocoris tenuis]|uniref:Uncharacterized protein n=1 Tax=Nesidiocoris tenuis TaxID=355587 RepID=A0A6H5HJ53_9HEMI|nr:unnamed protein product [Nesidiocoris tenuis]